MFESPTLETPLNQVQKDLDVVDAGPLRGPNTLKLSKEPILKKHKVFTCTIETYLKDTNAYGNVYFARYFEWQGVVREKWFSECVVKNMFELECVLITKKALNEYCGPVYPFEKIEGRLRVGNIRKTSFDIQISFFKKEKEISIGSQTIVISDKFGKIIKIPTEIKEKILEYEHF